MLAAQLNELGVSQQSQSQPEAPPRNNRQTANIITSSSSSSAAAIKTTQTPPTSNNHHAQPVNPLDPIVSSDTDSEPDEPNDRARNDGTLLASDPPKPL